jgi:YHS domain-containing protein
MAAHGGHGHEHGAGAPVAQAVRDPVCGMTVDPATSRHRVEHEGQTFHFCSAGCVSKPPPHRARRAMAVRRGRFSVLPSASLR